MNFREHICVWLRVVVSWVLCIVVLGSVGSAQQVYYESAAVGRIVGDTPDELLDQLGMGDGRNSGEQDIFDLEYGMYVTPEGSGFGPGILPKPNHEMMVKLLMESSFQEKEVLDNFWNMPWSDLDNRILYWDKKPFFVLEAYKGGIDDKGMWTRKAGIDDDCGDSYCTRPSNTNHWTDSFQEYKPLFLFDSDYGGLYIPKKLEGDRSFIGKFGQDAITIAPTAADPDKKIKGPEREFIKYLMCSFNVMAKRKLTNERKHTLGDIYRTARNAYYWNNDKPSGLALMSYGFYGLPYLKAHTDKGEVPTRYEYSPRQWADFRECDSVYKFISLEAKSEAQQIKGTVLGTLNLETLSPQSYFTVINFSVGNYSVVNVTVDNETNETRHMILTEHAELDYIYDELVLPRAYAKMEFPLKTVIENITLLSLSDPVDLNVSDMPLWEGEFTDRLVDNGSCWTENRSAGITYKHSYTEDSEVVVVAIDPVEIVNCTGGRFRLYRNITYRIDYIPYSPVLIESIGYSSEALPNEIVNLTVNLTSMQPDPVEGSLVLTQNGVLIAKNGVYTNETSHMIQFISPLGEGVYEYRLDFFQGNDSKTYTEFLLEVSVLDAQLVIPDLVDENATVGIRIYLKLNDTMNCTVDDYLTSSAGDLLDYSSSQQGIYLGYNEINLTYTQLNRKNQSYSIVVDLICAEHERILSGSIITNHYPVLRYIDDITLNESENVTITVNATDLDNDTLQYSINDSRFAQDNNTFTWQTSHTDIGSYKVLIKITDGLLNESPTVNVVVENKPPTARFTYSPTNPKPNETINFTDNSTDPNGTITSYYWSFGDGVNSTEQNPTHQYEAAGGYVVTLTVADDSGGSGEAQEYLVVYGDVGCTGINPPLFGDWNITESTGCVGVSVSLSPEGMLRFFSNQTLTLEDSEVRTDSGGMDFGEGGILVLDNATIWLD